MVKTNTSSESALLIWHQDCLVLTWSGDAFKYMWAMFHLKIPLHTSIIVPQTDR